MKLKSAILLVLLITVPIALLTWLGVRLAQNEQAVIQQRFQKLLTSRLVDIDDQIANYLNDLERSLQVLTDRDDFDPESLRAAVRSEPDVTTLFVMDAQNRIVFPNPQSMNRNEEGFLERADQVLDDKDLFFSNEQPESQSVPLPSGLESVPGFETPEIAFNQVDDQASGLTGKPQTQNRRPGSLQQTEQTQQAWINKPSVNNPAELPQMGNQQRMQIAQSSNMMTNATVYAGNGNGPGWLPSQPTSTGWISWFWGRGVHLIYWQRRSSGYLVGTEVHRSRLISSIIANLPATPSSPTGSTVNRVDDADSMIRLMDSSSRTLYQWGRYPVADDAESFCEIPVVNPLSSWRLKYYVPIAQLTAGAGQGIYYNLVTGLTVAALGIGALGFLAWREYSRDMREAAERVSFVNQVSHELKTPLTNIRMYADLLDGDLEVLDDVGDGPRGRLDVIQSESQRLSRLIANVLTFAGKKRKTLQLARTNVVIDDIVHETLKQFRPSLEQAKLETVFQAAASRTVSVDADAVEQIVGNLINNVEKYAADGGQLTITTRQTDRVTIVEVADNGQGVSKAMRKKIFQPFARASDSLHRAAGTGIGLSIARDLARLHGGDLRLLESPRGALFQLELPHKTQDGKSNVS